MTSLADCVTFFNHTVHVEALLDITHGADLINVRYFLPDGTEQVHTVMVKQKEVLENLWYLSNVRDHMAEGIFQAWVSFVESSTG